MYSKLLVASPLLFAAARAQLAGTLTAENHPGMSWQRCANRNSCSTVNGKVVLDSNWRWLHDKNGATNCYNGNTWDNALCPNNAQCTSNCALDGADYSGTYGVTAGGNSLKLQFVTNGPYSKNIGSRLYLMENDNKYQMFNLLNNEFTFDVDLSNLPCGLNGALYFVSMDSDGGMSKYSTNKAGAKYGTGYCDAQCPRDLKFINGQANREGWKSSSNDANAGVGNFGSCCAEMDIWEANSISTAVTPHSCSPVGQTRCQGESCGGTYSSDRYGGNCDPDGCDFNSYRMGDTSFYGPGKKIDTKRKFTVVTQFIGNPLTEIKRFYVQDNKVWANSASKIPGVTGNSITTGFCNAQKKAFGDVDPFSKHGGMTNMGQAMAKGMVLVMSLWDDHYANMLWLDSTYPTTSTKLGSARGTCPTNSGVPSDVENNAPNSSVTFSNIKFGPIGSTFNQAAAVNP